MIFLTYILISILLFTLFSVLIMLSFFSHQIRRLFSKRETNRRGNPNRNEQNPKVHYEKKSTRKKIFGANEGEYVDYEEIKK